MSYSENKTYHTEDYEPVYSNVDNKLKYKPRALCENGCDYCTGCASAQTGGGNYV